MEGIPNKALEALGPFPILQGIVGILVVLACIYAALRAARDKDRKPDQQQIPQWLMMGPLHDMMEAVHDVAEESRRANELLRESKDAILACKTTLELIRNESRLR